MKKTAILLFVLLLECVMSSHSVWAQGVYGTVQGTVTDRSGAAIMGAEVSAHEEATGIVQKVLTNPQGIYVIANMEPGTYDVVLHSAGFTEIRHVGVVVHVGDVISLDMSPSVSGASTTIDVSAGATALRTDDTIVSDVIEEEEIKGFPLDGRSAFDLELLAPGVMQTAVSNGTSSDSQPRLSGGRGRTNEVTLDGTSITDPRRGSTVVAPNLDAIQEFAVILNGIPAQYGRLSGGVVAATMKSGTNDFHGDVFEFYEGSGLGAARNYFATTVPKLVYNQFGGILGGPIRRNKLFFFADYQGTRDRGEKIYKETIPTPAEIQGDFSGILSKTVVGTDALGRPVYKNQIFDPATTRMVNGQVVRDPFKDNKITQDRWDPAGALILAQHYPAPNATSGGNFYGLIPNGYNHDQADGKVTMQINPTNLAFVRLSFDRKLTMATRPWASAGGHFGGGELDTFFNSSMAWTHIFSSSVVNDVRIGFLRGELNRLGQSDTASGLGIPNLAQASLPLFNPSGYAEIGNSAGFDPVEQEYQVTDNLTVVKGKHILAFGADFRRFNINDLQLTQTTYTFNPLQTSNGVYTTTGNSIASLLLGLASSYTADPNTGRFYERSNYLGAYGQDTYKITKDLTLNYGLRYEVEQNPNEVHWNGSNFDITSGQVITMRQLGTNRIQHTQWGGFGPRVGFAWNAFGKGTIVRGSYGIFYAPLTGMATSAYNRFPKDRTFYAQTVDYTAAVVVSQTPAVPANTNGYGLSHEYDVPNAHAPYYQQVSFDLQHQFPWKLVVYAGYTNSVSRHLWQDDQYNQIPLAEVQAAGGGTQSMRPYPNFSTISGMEREQNTSYNAFLFQAKRSYNNGISLRTAFTWSKFIDVVDDNFSGLNPQDQYNMKAERGLSLANIPTRLVVSGLYALPLGKGRHFLQHGIVGEVVGGWNLSSIFTVQSGQQTWVYTANNTSETFSQMMRPNLTGSPFLPKNQRSIKKWINTSAFSTPSLLTFGTSPKTPNIQGPMWYTLDFALRRMIQLPFSNSKRLELRGECYDCLNHPNFMPPSGIYSNTTFGQITSAHSARIIQVGAKVRF